MLKLLKYCLVGTTSLLLGPNSFAQDARAPSCLEIPYTVDDQSSFLEAYGRISTRLTSLLPDGYDPDGLEAGVQLSTIEGIIAGEGGLAQQAVANAYQRCLLDTYPDKQASIVRLLGQFNRVRNGVRVERVTSLSETLALYDALDELSKIDPFADIPSEDRITADQVSFALGIQDFTSFQSKGKKGYIRSGMLGEIGGCQSRVRASLAVIDENSLSTLQFMVGILINMAGDEYTRYAAYSDLAQFAFSNNTEATAKTVLEGLKASSSVTETPSACLETSNDLIVNFVEADVDQTIANSGNQ